MYPSKFWIEKNPSFVTPFIHYNVVILCNSTFIILLPWDITVNRLPEPHRTVHWRCKSCVLSDGRTEWTYSESRGDFNWATLGHDVLLYLLLGRWLNVPFILFYMSNEEYSGGIRPNVIIFRKDGKKTFTHLLAAVGQMLRQNSPESKFI